MSWKLPRKLISWVSTNTKMPNCIGYFCSANHRGDSYGSTSTTSNISFQLRRTWSSCKYGLVLEVLYTWCTVLFLWLFSSRCWMLRDTQLINENVAKNNWLQKFENFSEKILWWSSFSKVTSLQYSDCNFAIKRTHHRLFLE